MTKIIVEFNIPEDAEDFDAYCNAMKYKQNLSEIYNLARNELKYGHCGDRERVEFVLEEIRKIAFIDEE